jgi:hypothetical protein
MADVSCKVIIDLLEYGSQRGFSDARILKNTPERFSLEYLRNPQNYVPWDLFCQICTNISDAHGDETWAQDYAYSSFGRKSLHFGMIRKAAGVIAGAKVLYWSGQKWAAPSNFRNVTWKYESLSSHQIRLTATIRPSYRDFPLVMVIGKYIFEILPTFLGLPDAKVDLELRPHVGIYTIDLPSRENA